MAQAIVVAKALLINEKHEVLVLHRSPWPGHEERSHMPDLPGGLIEEGESPAFTTAREIKEETDIEVREDQLVMGYTKTFYDEVESESHTKFLYVCQLDQTPGVTLSHEHELSEWTPIDQLLSAHQFGPFYAEGIDYLISHKII
jgi:8-oxo-dGTP pyrophosphatase MutT (NUDIX family)